MSILGDQSLSFSLASVPLNYSNSLNKLTVCVAPYHISMAFSMQSFSRNLVKSFTALLSLKVEIANLLSRVTTGGHLLQGVESVGFSTMAGKCNKRCSYCLGQIVHI